MNRCGVKRRLSLRLPVVSIAGLRRRARRAAGTRSGSVALCVSAASIGSSTSLASTPGRKAPVYYNFATPVSVLRDAAGSESVSHRRPRREAPAREGGLLLVAPRTPNPNDPLQRLNIFRREFSDFSSAAKLNPNIMVSVDTSTRRFLEMFCDFDAKRCKLCNETFLQWHIHANGIPHAGREGMLLELVRPYCGTPDELIEMWWQRLNSCAAFHRIPGLSHDNPHERKRRLLYLLKVLKDRGILVETFNVSDNQSTNSARSWEFERLEFVGDNVVKYVLNNIISCAFPPHEGGTKGKMTCFQFVMDGNDGLARGYDHLDLQQLASSPRVVSKFKSDIVETLFAELQMYLWSTQHDIGTCPLVFPFTKDIYTLRALVQHVLYELGIELFLYHIRHINGMLQRVMRENHLQFVKADSALKPRAGARTGSLGVSTRRGDWSDDDDDYDCPQSYGTPAVSAPTAALMKVRSQRTHVQGTGAALFFASTNYDNFKRVVPIGGLLPRPFARQDLSVIPNHMPHLRSDGAMTRRMRRVGNAGWSTLHATATALTTLESVADGLALSAETTPRVGSEPVRLSVPRLKDEELIPELI
ncbi:RNA editing complex protein MP61 [Leishmania major strain Friedlin]|uniref:MP61 n=1 Tax=Leishmania major TaxID=5664 RepID=Q6T449_LEIMA|nr:RNA editing complex protein MP61 [Leishmania major strain Friedlin]AAR10826.1 MP61 [Leishmania major]CAG9583623.1 RNA_editing_complex_protein_MP61 [Leishmania major strain Friedlin]CAJ09058.1 RNA editing complex protein MP61 [Leishmania major strain Friedlin]|eukprot:XP_001686677.1 RNA editing complex protein MP61 [Leishmania major strain Friedlin]